MHQLFSTTVGLVLSGGVGLFTMAIAIFAFRRYSVAAYQRVLLVLLGSLTLFTAAHWLVLIWPAHTILLDLLEPLSYTGFLVMVYQFTAIHPQIRRNTRGDER